MKDSGKATFDASADTVDISTDCEKFDDGCIPQLTRTPKHTWAVLIAEICERFSYYGIKTVLFLYLTEALHLLPSIGKAHYHGFSFVSTFTGIFGAIMADSAIGKFKTIAWTLVVYSAAEILLTLTTIPSIGRGSSVGPLISLYIMAISAGNIKPCMAAFGGEQFNQKDTGLVSTFFSMFYMSVNIGAVLTMVFIPMIRTDIKCFGENCYSVVYGVCAIIIIMATVSFALGSPWYTKKISEGNMIIKVYKIIKKAEIDNVRALLKVLVMYIPLPVFWALFLQQGSSWTLQATQMDGDLGAAGTLRSDQMQFINPAIVLIMIPMFDYIIYPMFERCGFPLSPLKKMTGGMILAAIAFAVTGFMQIKIQDVNPAPPLPPITQTSVDFINISPCKLIEIQPDDFSKISLPYGAHTSHKVGQAGNRTFDIKGVGCYAENDAYRNNVVVNLHPGKLINVLIDIDDMDKMEVHTVEHVIPDVSVNTAQTRVRLFYVPSSLTPSVVTLKYQHKLEKDKSTVLNNYTSFNATHSFLSADEYIVQVSDSGKQYPVSYNGDVMKFGTFGAYTVALKRPMSKKSSEELVAHVYEDVPSSHVHRIWQLPQYVIITAGEIMFSVTGIEFAYSQAPSSMKSVLQACWLLTAAFGDLIVVILSLAKPVDGVEKEMFLYGGVMLVVAFIFSIMSYFYTYSDFSGNNDIAPLDEKTKSDELLNKSDSTTHL